MAKKTCRTPVIAFALIGNNQRLNLISLYETVGLKYYIARSFNTLYATESKKLG